MFRDPIMQFFQAVEPAPPESSVFAVHSILQKHELVGLDIHASRHGDGFFLMELINQFAGNIFRAAAGEKFIVIYPFFFKILHFDPEGIRFQAQINIFGNKDDLPVRELLFEHGSHIEDPVVRHTHISILKEKTIADDHPQGTALIRLGGIIQAYTGKKAAFFPELIQFPDHMAGISAQFILIPFELIQFFQNSHGDDNFVVGKGFEGGGTVEKHIGVEDKDLFVVHK